MKKLSTVALLDIGLHLIVVGWLVILLRKSAAAGVHLTAVEFAIPVLVALVLVLLLKLIQYRKHDQRSNS